MEKKLQLGLMGAATQINPFVLMGAGSQPIAHLCYDHDDITHALAMAHAYTHEPQLPIIFMGKPQENMFLIKKFNDLFSPIQVLGFNLGYGDNTKILIKNGFDKWDSFYAEYLLIKNKKSKQTRSVRLAIENTYKKITK